jgi:RNA polymerase sigma factor (sigma-70 family)
MKGNHTRQPSPRNAAVIQNESEMIPQLTSADKDRAWEKCFDSLTPLLFQIARRRGVTVEEADDVVQETMTALVREILMRGHDPKRASLKTRAVQIAERKVVDCLRLKRKHAVLAANLADFHASERAGSHEREQRLQVVTAAIQNVRQTASPADFAIFERSILDEVPPHVIALELRKSVKAIYNAAARIKALLRIEAKRILATS